MSDIKKQFLTTKLTLSDSKKIMWFIVPKTGSRSIHDFFDNQFPPERSMPLTEDSHNYFKFSFVRCPFDRLLSCYLDKIIKKIPTQTQYRSNLRWEMNYTKPTFCEFVETVTLKENIDLDRHWRPIHNLIPVEHLDYIGKLESLDNDFKKLCNIIDIAYKPLPRINITHHGHYAEYYNNYTRELVEQSYSLDLETFNYTF